MSWWATLEAEFVGKTIAPADLVRGMPLGSEWKAGTYGDFPCSGTLHVEKDRISISARLRDVSDFETSPAVLAWFTHTCGWLADEASLTFDLDAGPRYRYTWTPSVGLTRLRGILEP